MAVSFEPVAALWVGTETAVIVPPYMVMTWPLSWWADVALFVHGDVQGGSTVGSAGMAKVVAVSLSVPSQVGSSP